MRVGVISGRLEPPLDELVLHTGMVCLLHELLKSVSIVASYLSFQWILVSM